MRASFAHAATALLALPASQLPPRCANVRCFGGTTYTVRLVKPLGIQFEENTPGEAEGVTVAGLVEGGNAELDGRVCVGDTLVKVSAVQFAGQSALVSLGGGQQFTSFTRELIPCTNMDFDTIMGAIGSNEGRYGYTDVVLELRKTDNSIPRAPSKDYQRLETDASKSVEWDASRGTQVNGKSTPLRPPPDKFGGYLGGLESRKVRLQPRLVGVGSATRSSARARVPSMMATVPSEVASCVKWDYENSPYDPNDVEGLWDALVELYGSEELAITAAKQVRGDVICPLFASPDLLRESYEALVDNLGETEAREIMAKHPSILTCGPGVRNAEPDEIRRLAAFRQVADQIPPQALLGGVLGISAIIFGKIALIKMGMSDGVF